MEIVCIYDQLIWFKQVIYCVCLLFYSSCKMELKMQTSQGCYKKWHSLICELGANILHKKLDIFILIPRTDLSLHTVSSS